MANPDHYSIMKFVFMKGAWGMLQSHEKGNSVGIYFDNIKIVQRSVLTTPTGENVPWGMLLNPLLSHTINILIDGFLFVINFIY